MTSHSRFPILPGALLVSLAACQAAPPSAAQAAATARLAALPAAQACHAALPVFGRFPTGVHSVGLDIYLPPDGRITMDNDGGWCAIRFSHLLRGAIPVIGRLRLLHPPRHGAVQLGTLDGKMVIAYRPAQGFAGPDRFTVRMGGPQPWTIPVQVQVHAG